MVDLHAYGYVHCSLRTYLYLISTKYRIHDYLISGIFKTWLALLERDIVVVMGTVDVVGYVSGLERSH